MKRSDFLKALGLSGLTSVFPSVAEAEQPKIVPLHDVETVHFGEGIGRQVKACYLDGERITNVNEGTFCQSMNVKEGWVNVLALGKWREGGIEEYTRRYGRVTYELYGRGERPSYSTNAPFDGAATKLEGLSVRESQPEHK